MKYNKLVRDYIPEKIAETGQKAIFTVLSSSEYLEYLEKKLDEEVAEFHESKNLEELADIMEVICAIAAEKGSHIHDVDIMRSNKSITHGTFSRKILLLEVDDG